MLASCATFWIIFSFQMLYNIFFFLLWCNKVKQYMAILDETTERLHMGQKSVFFTLGGQVQPFVASQLDTNFSLEEWKIIKLSTHFRAVNHMKYSRNTGQERFVFPFPISRGFIVKQISSILQRMELPYFLLTKGF